MKKYIVFSYYAYYPSGGLTDIIFQTDEFMDVIDFKQEKEVFHTLELLNTVTGMKYIMDDGYWKEQGLLQDDKTNIDNLR